MQQNQSALGRQKENRLPSYGSVVKIGRVASAKDYRKKGTIEVTFLDYGAPLPVWVIGSIDREPVTGDMVVIGYMEASKENPYLIGFIQNKSYTSNNIIIEKDRILFQFPTSEEDRKAFNTGDKAKMKRVYAELTKDAVKFVHPDVGHIKLEKGVGVEAYSKTTMSLKAAGAVTIEGQSVALKGSNTSNGRTIATV